MRLDPLVEDTLAALVATSLLGAAIALVYWLLTGISPWPFVILGETSGLGFGVAMLALSARRVGDDPEFQDYFAARSVSRS